MEKLNHQKKSRMQAEADFLPQLERGSQISLEKQLVRAVREAIASRDASAFLTTISG